jgi:DNA-binding response OmpR family regulator
VNDYTSNTISSDGITIQTEQGQVSVLGDRVDLTYIEYLLLKTLVEERGRVISRDSLLERVWSYGNVNTLETRTVDVHIGRLRKKLGRASKHIVTVRSVGYRMAFSPEWVVR